MLTNDRIRADTVHRRKDGTTYPVELETEHVIVNDETSYVVAVARDVSEERAHRRRIDVLYSTAREISDAETSQRIAETLVGAARDSFESSLAAVWFHDDGRLSPAAWTEEVVETVGDVPTFEGGQSTAWQVFETGESRYVEDVSTLEGPYNPETPIRSEALFPLGEHGVVALGTTSVDAFEETDVLLAEILTNHAETALDRVDGGHGE